MAGTKKNEVTIEMKPMAIRTATVNIVGDADIVLNKMNDVTVRTLTDIRKNKAKSMDVPNEWEEIITAMHWYNGKPTDFSKEGLEAALKENSPCITAFGLKKSFMNAVVRNKIDTYSTGFDASVNILARGGLVPIKFTEHYIDEKLMTPKKGSPVLARLNRFRGWSADIQIQFVETAYSLEQILNIINYAGFGIGIGSGRSSGFGRYHVESVK